MRRLASFILGAVMTLPGPALAAEIVAKDRAAIGHCVDAAHEKQKFGDKCVGLLADPCIAEAGQRDSSVEDAKACAARELAVWSERLDAAIKKASASGLPSIRPTLGDAQKTWLNSREKLCSLFNDLDPGANVGGSDYCRLQETSRRDLLLERLVGAVSEH
jgi:uncharacterized protein YecT (DUF1311 family)